MNTTLSSRVQSPPLPGPGQFSLFGDPAAATTKPAAAGVRHHPQPPTHLRASQPAALTPGRPARGVTQVQRRRPLPPPPPVVRLRECQKYPELFDLPEVQLPIPEPEPIPEGAGRRPATVSLWPTSLMDLDSEERSVTSRARAARIAQAACRGCAFLTACRKDVLEGIEVGSRPQDAVVAEVVWTEAGVPDAHAHGLSTAREPAQLALDTLADVTLYRSSPELDWLPADLAPLSAVDETIVEAVLSELANSSALDRDAKEKWMKDRFVTEYYLAANPGSSADGREIISRAEEWEIVRRAGEKKLPPYAIATMLQTGWDRAARLAFEAGFEVDNYEPTEIALANRERRVRDEAAARRKAESLRAAQSTTLRALGA